VTSQLRLIAQDFNKLVLPTDDEKRRAFEAANAATDSGNDGGKWRRGEQEYETLMKHLDNYVSGTFSLQTISNNYIFEKIFGKAQQ